MPIRKNPNNGHAVFVWYDLDYDAGSCFQVLSVIGGKNHDKLEKKL